MKSVAQKNPPAADAAAEHLADVLRWCGDRIAAILAHVPAAFEAFGADFVILLYFDDARVLVGPRLEVARAARARDLPADILADLDAPAPVGTTRVLAFGPGENIATGILRRLTLSRGGVG